MTEQERVALLHLAHGAKLHDDRPETIDQKIKRYLPLLHHIGKNYRYKMQPDDYDDAVTEAMCAIQRGIETYSGRVKVSLDTYVGTCICNAFNGYVRSLYSGQKGFEAGCVAFSDVFPDGNLPESPGADLADEIDGYEVADDAEIDLLRLMAKDWPGAKRDREIIQMRLNGYTFLEIGEAYDISKQRAFQVYSRAVRKIKAYWDR